MTYRSLAVLLTAVLIGSSIPSHAEVSVTFSTGRGWQSREHHPRYSTPYYYHPYARPYRRHVVYYAPPVIVPAPVYYQAPVPAPYPSVSVPLTGNYGSDLAGLHEKLSRLRSVTERQYQKGQITKDQYDRFMNSLEGIEHDEHARAYDRGGNLAPEDFDNLYRRLNQTGEDIEIALAG